MASATIIEVVIEVVLGMEKQEGNSLTAGRAASDATLRLEHAELVSTGGLISVGGGEGDQKFPESVESGRPAGDETDEGEATFFSSVDVDVEGEFTEWSVVGSGELSRCRSRVGSDSIKGSSLSSLLSSSSFRSASKALRFNISSSFPSHISLTGFVLVEYLYK